MSAHCHHNHEVATGLIANFAHDFFSYDSLILIITLFLTGLAGSFTHCIGMCGPIASGQMSLRLMTISADKMSEWRKVKAAFITPYYLGKAITYCLMASTIFLFANYLQSVALQLRYLAAALLFFTAFLFLKSALSRKFIFINANKVRPIRYINSLIINKFSKLQYNTHGWPGVWLGMILGLIPCGLVYASIATIIAKTDNLLVLNVAMAAFALATIPGLFIVAYLGQQLFARWQRIFELFYILMMGVNAWLLCKAALDILY